jgi:hypothetical protein
MSIVIIAWFKLARAIARVYLQKFFLYDSLGLNKYMANCSYNLISVGWHNDKIITVQSTPKLFLLEYNNLVNPFVTDFATLTGA